MPLVVITGYPGSGKSTAARELKRLLEEERGRMVDLVSDNDLVKGTSDKKSVYGDATKEKTLRGELKAAALRLLSKDRVLILDGLNYIKGFR